MVELKESKPLFTCLGCEKQAYGFANDRGDFIKPWKWYQRTIKNDDGKRVTQVACSRACLEEIGGFVAPW